MTRAAVLVVTKAPVPGAAKTRLCPPATPAQAAAIAAASLLDTLDAARGRRTVVALTGRLRAAAGRGELLRALARCSVVGQDGAGLGTRLAAAHRAAAALLGPGPVVQLGMDTPQLTPALLEAAAVLLSGADAVLGPAVDGGWWALGLHDPRHAAVLAAVPMSRSDTGGRTLHALRRGGLRVALLPPLRDVDTMADAELVAADAPDGRFAAAVAAVGARSGARA